MMEYITKFMGCSLDDYCHGRYACSPDPIFVAKEEEKKKKNEEET